MPSHRHTRAPACGRTPLDELSGRRRDLYMRNTQQKLETNWQDRSNSITGLDRPRGFQEVEAPRFKDNRHMNVLSLSALRTGRLYPPGSIPGTHFCYRLSRPQGHSATRRSMSMKNANDTIGNRTLDLLTCSAVP